MDMYLQREWEPGGGGSLGRDIPLHPRSHFKFHGGQTVQMADGRRGRIIMRNNRVGEPQPYCLCLEGPDEEHVWVAEAELTGLIVEGTVHA